MMTIAWGIFGWLWSSQISRWVGLLAAFIGVAGEFLKPVASGLGKAAVWLLGAFMDGLAGITSRPTVLVVLASCVAVTWGYMRIEQSRYISALAKARTEIATYDKQCGGTRAGSKSCRTRTKPELPSFFPFNVL